MIRTKSGIQHQQSDQLALFRLSEVEHNFRNCFGGTATDKFPFGFAVFPKIDSTELVVERVRGGREKIIILYYTRIKI